MRKKEYRVSQKRIKKCIRLTIDQITYITHISKIYKCPINRLILDHALVTAQVAHVKKTIYYVHQEDDKELKSERITLYTYRHHIEMIEKGLPWIKINNKTATLPQFIRLIINTLISQYEIDKTQRSVMYDIENSEPLPKLII